MRVRSAVGLRAVVPLAAAALLGTLAIVTVDQAGCADPGHYERVQGGYQLVGGCFDPADLVVPQAPPVESAATSVPARG
ncbi:MULTISPECIES: hypothetical protein [Pseudonocardia]|uniref:Secreted protein n=1 Tax=Pseudonocardia oroxyli TaxID=366584 RepID=A0A1G7QAU5_PSEOR|nr:MULTISPECIES: hypothetical protein [Pseudonocardia]MCF7551223.1 hypothetical protein [Pseudonocardia sp. WMMC193]SDF95565.1 hypothetical protein SAMN05216377_10820 [Pseudonocardia oroxyli]